MPSSAPRPVAASLASSSPAARDGAPKSSPRRNRRNRGRLTRPSPSNSKFFSTPRSRRFRSASRKSRLSRSSSASLMSSSLRRSSSVATRPPALDAAARRLGLSPLDSAPFLPSLSYSKSLCGRSRSAAKSSSRDSLPARSKAPKRSCSLRASMRSVSLDRPRRSETSMARAVSLACALGLGRGRFWPAPAPAAAGLAGLFGAWAPRL
mmetsp:Transcript_40144/g.125705  ORF Transcript_40144/g.125705 Transcript_40144/m.125705 type:complete len:208 (-) Transcript_40144:2382-3005(-)